MTTKNESGIMQPPATLGAILRACGPGMILAAGVVGSGELIATTKTGAEAGWALLPLILIGCLIKVPVQLQLGSFAFTSGKGTIAALDELPGPRLRVSWVLWMWLVMQVTTVMQLGGILHGIGQALAMLLPLSGDYTKLLAAQQASTGVVPAAVMTYDDICWAVLVAAAVVFLLRGGGYAIVERFSKYMVVSFTALTMCCVGALQFTDYSITWAHVQQAFSFSFLGEGQTGLSTALATWGIIGMGATDLVGYIYWMQGKGYAAYAGVPHSEGWLERARGWVRVMRWDAGTAAAAYTFATVCFFTMGAAVLYVEHLNPSGSSMIKTLSQSYVPFFGAWTAPVFLLGAATVLFSTFTIGTATHSRVQADAVRVFKLGAGTEDGRLWWIKAFSILLPIMAVFFLVSFRQPVFLILIAGVFQGIMLPILGFAALYFRYKRNDSRLLRPNLISDAILWLSTLGMLGTGVWAVFAFSWKVAH